VLAAQIVGRGRLECVDVPMPTLGSEPGVLLRTLRASICGSDAHTVYGGIGVTGYPCPPGAPGHEAVGEVVDSSAPGFAAGDRVLAVPVPRTARAFAEYQVVPPGSLLPLPAGSPLDSVLAQQLGTVVFALRRFWPAPDHTRPASTALVLGAGSAGLFFVQLLCRAGFERVLVADLDPGRLARAARLGAAVTIDARHASPAEVALHDTGGVGADLVVEAAGHDQARAEAVHAVAVDGRLGLFGLPERPGMSPFPMEVLFRRRPTIEIAWGAQTEPGLASFREALRLLAAGEVDGRGFTTHVEPIERISEALAIAAERRDGALKVAIDF
jgi:L-iditol 2-dehydrogenase